MRHAEIAKAPCHGRSDIQQAVGGGTVIGHIVAGHHGQVARQAAGIVQHHIPAAGHTDAVHQHGDQGHAHDDGLDQVGGGHGAEAAHDGVAHNDHGRQDHGDHVVHAKQAVEQLAAGRKAGGGVRDEEHDDDDRAQGVEQVALVMEAQRQKLRHRDGVQVCRVAAQAAGHDEPVEPSAHGKADGRPARGCNTGEVRKARHTHQQPAGHIAGLGAHGRDQRAHLTAAEVEIAAVLVGFAIDKANQQHSHQIDHDGGNDADVDHFRLPLSFFPSLGIYCLFYHKNPHSCKLFGQFRRVNCRFSGF